MAGFERKINQLIDRSRCGEGYFLFHCPFTLPATRKQRTMLEDRNLRMTFLAGDSISQPPFPSRVYPAAAHVISNGERERERVHNMIFLRQEMKYTHDERAACRLKDRIRSSVALLEQT